MHISVITLLTPFVELEGFKKAQEASKLAQRRSQAVVVGDLQPLVAALPALHDKDTVDTNKCAPRYFCSWV